ncbi:GPI mannosyltransferase 1 [Trichophyton interdigitale]|uniref:GPI mannosyltransferase 1 n=1 Tax=Trichophyton interdigitale TaxID=101480 RepID=A0A9P4YFS9_9EURO|nr:GPI mannosyltransferase 1 [Trichophyton interdigitale]KAF3896562.1 GPI mannosyltransferase 1 [Trichophyton interdigitale]KAG8208777.1 GPI mannosyltransferase 1 [Trichophyton interdigitale]
MAWFFSSPYLVFGAAILLRVVLLFYGLYQDSHSPMKYTDIDYYVFTDAAKFVSEGQSPYDRATYRYTPLLAWILLPTTWTGLGGQQVWFSFGKALFAVSDIIAGWLILHVLRSHQRMDMQRALKFSSIWLLNPMVATISTRGSSEGFLCVMIMALLWAVLEKRTILAGVLLGFGVHFKIYPFIYGPSIIWFLEDEENDSFNGSKGFTLGNLTDYVCRLVTPQRIILGLTSLVVFAGLNVAMYMLYGTPFLQHTYLHHVTRVDHRHNFSPYNMLLYLSSSEISQGIPGNNFESLAFLPQLGLSAILIPLALAKRDLAGSMLSQTFAFVTFNKVCTSQYFLWYLVFLPLYLPYSSLIKQPLFGITVAALWAGAQALWLHQGFQLEFLGVSTFVPGLYLSSLAFFMINIWILGIIISDIKNLPRAGKSEKGKGNNRSPAAVKKDI